MFDFLGENVLIITNWLARLDIVVNFESQT
jgi:hypothetical protein